MIERIVQSSLLQIRGHINALANLPADSDLPLVRVLSDIEAINRGVRDIWERRDSVDRETLLMVTRVADAVFHLGLFAKRHDASRPADVAFLRTALQPVNRFAVKHDEGLSELIIRWRMQYVLALDQPSGPKAKAKPGNYDRDDYAYKLAVKGKTWRVVMASTNRRGDSRAWAAFSDEQHARKAVIRHVKNHNLPEVPKRKK